MAEGPNLIESAARHDLIEEIFATETAAERHRELLAGLPVQFVTERAAKALSETVTPAGLIAVCAFPDVDLNHVLSQPVSVVVVAVETSEPGNAGTLIRLADAMGAAVVVFAGNSVDPYNAKCLRSSAGSIFNVPVLSEPDTDALISSLRAAGLQILATTLDGTLSLDDADDILAEPVAWMFGPESQGLSDHVAGLADHRVKIPMVGGAESLNVAAAAAICLYQSARVQRIR